MIKSDTENGLELAQLLFELTQAEGNCITIYHPNMDFDGHKSMIEFVTGWGETKHVFGGDSVLDCLHKARASYDIED